MVLPHWATRVPKRKMGLNRGGTGERTNSHFGAQRIRRCIRYGQRPSGLEAGVGREGGDGGVTLIRCQSCRARQNRWMLMLGCGAALCRNLVQEILGSIVGSGCVCDNDTDEQCGWLRRTKRCGRKHVRRTGSSIIPERCPTWNVATYMESITE
jgi:hypothetical protein